MLNAVSKDMAAAQSMYILEALRQAMWAVLLYIAICVLDSKLPHGRMDKGLAYSGRWPLVQIPLIPFTIFFHF